MFQSTRGFNQPIGGWQLGTGSHLTTGINMANMFYDSIPFNQDLGSWDVSKVVSMANMFRENTFNNSGSSNINNWRPISCSNFSDMFNGASSFNQPVGNWPLSGSNITMNNMFRNATSFNQNLDTWDVSRVTIMNDLFTGASSFNQNIGSWNVSNVTSMWGMFRGPNSFNNGGSSTINNWNVSKVTIMQSMFNGATAFNQPIGSWQPVSCSDFSFMFNSATAFNQPVETWVLPTDRTFTMASMFSGATSFNQPLGLWTIVSCSSMASMLNSCGMDINNYSQTLIGWASQPAALIPRNITLGATGRQYNTPGSASRAILTSSPYNWTITGDTFVP
jgi:surface protein